MRILGIVASDRTFRLAELRGAAVWLGKCLMCGTKLMVSVDGALQGKASVEHLRPRTHGGDDSLANLALACRRCNAQKGARWDLRHADDPRRLALLDTLLARRAERWRHTPPPELGGLDDRLLQAIAAGPG